MWLTTDTDFLAIAATKSATGHEFAPILFWPQQARGVRELIAAILQLAGTNEYSALCSRVFYL
jgi:hypothetical protein